MSLGHMTAREQAISILGPMLVLLVSLLVAHNISEPLGIVLGVGGLVLVFALKAWCWSHTAYVDGLSNPIWVDDKEESHE